MQAQTPLTPDEVKTYSDRIDRYYTESPSRTKQAEISAGFKAGDTGPYCRINGEDIAWYRQAKAEAFAALTALRAQGKSTDLIHHAYLSLSWTADGRVITDADACAKKRVDEGPDGLGGSRAELKVLTEALSAARADYTASLARGDDLNACADIRRAERMNAARLEEYKLLEQVYSLTLPASWAPFKDGYADAKAEAVELARLSGETCAKVNAPEPPPLPPIPQTPAQIAADAYTGRMLKASSAMMAFTLGDAASMCEAAQNSVRLIEEADAGLKADIARLEAEGQDVASLRSLMTSSAEMREKTTETRTKACKTSTNDARTTALMAEGEQLMQDYENAIADLQSTMKANDRVAACAASQRALKSLTRLDTVMREAMVLDAENLSAADKAGLDGSLKQLGTMIAQTREMSSDLCTVNRPVKKPKAK
ncbi:hypothetical protein EM6_0749 [Asticcacaulis excentricus]|uniref:Uncharacterized protein n=1 Tax=Asticcacaulis excentricus TaxID=78587 RepID=A0A3G9G344_9CAUL|nr:hypothetical protein EM6_0749 [Asticcacaulis excentricus]